VSIVTTTVPLKNGQMKDIRLHNKEMRRIKPPPQKVPGKINPGNPLQTADEQDEEKVRAFQIYISFLKDPILTLFFLFISPLCERFGCVTALNFIENVRNL